MPEPQEKKKGGSDLAARSRESCSFLTLLTAIGAMARYPDAGMDIVRVDQAVEHHFSAMVNSGQVPGSMTNELISPIERGMK